MGKRPPQALGRALVFGLFVKCGVGEIHIFLVHALLSQGNCLAEVINLSKSLETQCLQGFRGFIIMRENMRTSLDFCP